MEKYAYAVLGHPIAHTMSPFIHSRLFTFSGQKEAYGVLDVSAENLSSQRSVLRGMKGFNITIPHKQAIIPFLDGMDQKAETIGSVNTVKNGNGRLIGYTTDGEGFADTLRAAGEALCSRAVILGAGGAARAIAFEIASEGGEVTVAARPHGLAAAARLADELNGAFPGRRADACLLSEISGDIDLLVNATPCGMFPDLTGCPVSGETVGRARCVFDAVYNPGETELLRRARALGIKTVGGMGMLVRQAAAAQRIWLGSVFQENDLDQLCREASLEMRKRFGNIVLSGFMGSGKSTVGRVLAEKAGRSFVDLDRFIESKEGITVSEIFTRHGEPYFRELEAQAVKQLSLKSGLVLAAGGGTLLSGENARVCRTSGVIVFLDASLETIRRRLKNDISRPLLSQPDRDEAMERLYRERLEAYRTAADFTVKADGDASEVTAQSILDALGGSF